MELNINERNNYKAKKDSSNCNVYEMVRFKWNYNGINNANGTN